MSRHSFATRLSCLIALIACSVLSIGCGDDGKYTVTGTVTYKGNPVPAGEIRFTPDKGNQGAIILARIKDGHYATPEDKGIVGGAYQLRVTGYAAAGNSNDPTAPDFGKQMFKTYREDVEFAKEDLEHNIEIE